MLFAGFALVSISAQAGSIYVSPLGDDGDDGSLEKPLVSLRRAVELSREKIKPLKIVLRDGDYFETHVELKDEDSGLTIEAWPNETPVLYGGRRVTNWKQDGEHFFAAEFPEIMSGEWDFRALVVNDELRLRARLPESGRFEHESKWNVKWMSSTGGGWQTKPTQADLTSMKYKAGDLGEWLDLRNAELTVYHAWDESMVGLKSMNPTSRTLEFSIPTGHPPGAFPWASKSNTYVVWNVREGLKQPGQWYLDRTAGKIVYWPKVGEKIEDLKIVAPTGASIINFAGSEAKPVKDVHLRGLKFIATTAKLENGGFGALKLSGAIHGAWLDGCRITNSTLQAVGANAIRFWKAPRLKIENCKVLQTGAGGICVQASPQNVIHYNLVKNVGVYYPSGIGIMSRGANAKVGHNEIYNTSYSAINAAGDNILITCNRIARAMTVLNDGAAIYSFGSKGAVIRGNFAEDIKGQLAHAWYLDEQCENALVELNVSKNVAVPWHCHMAKGITFRNNYAQSDGDLIVSLPRSEKISFKNNIIECGGDLRFKNSQSIKMLSGNVFHVSGKILMKKLNQYKEIDSTEYQLKDGNIRVEESAVEISDEIYRLKKNEATKGLKIDVIDCSACGRRQHK